MSEVLWVSIVAGLIQLVSILSAFYIGSRKLPNENRKMTAEEKNIQAETIHKQGKTLDDAFDEINQLREDLNKAKDQITELNRDLRKWRNYAARLQRQIVEDLKGTPVPFDTDPPKK